MHKKGQHYGFKGRDSGGSSGGYESVDLNAATRGSQKKHYCNDAAAGTTTKRQQNHVGGSRAGT